MLKPSQHTRIVLNRFTAAFFTFSLIYCFAQGIVQSLLYTIDFEYNALVSGVVSAAAFSPNTTTYLEGSSGHLVLRMCDDIPHGQKVDPCIVVFNGTANQPPSSSQVRAFQNWQNAVVDIDPQLDPATAHVDNIIIRMPGTEDINLNEQCLQTLMYPSQILQNMKREDISWICLQFYLLVISLFAILNGSVPHILAVLMTRAISAAWAIYAVYRDPLYRGNLQQLLADPGTPCSLDIFSQYWSRRQPFEITDLVLSCTALIFFSYLSFTLLKIFSEQSFKCVGAPEHVMRIHKFFMAILACLQLEAFVLVTSGGLWIDILINTAILQISAHTKLYQALFISTTVILIPWISLGWYSIRREMKIMMVIFLAIGFIIITGWAMMFYSIVYRWSFLQWPYLGCFTVASFILLISSMILGVVCRVNFGKGLAQYLHAEETLSSLNFSPAAFTTKTDSMRFSRDSKHPEDFDEDSRSDILNSSNTPMYFVQNLSQAENGEVIPRPSTRAEPERSFFDTF
ncbi:hypothetical protein D9613_003786 [Agrocybe pediades]|uniref:Uncharacterized protein n=1 Tax=Agrocybe pediades TaxID=84607 RepID=A0A8H4QIJ2_9AGAR|nr:hypothetical protein D9613_003786 [Agrocybe pediades]